MTTKQIEAAVIKLPKRERLRLARTILETLKTKRERELIDAWLEEVEWREKELAEGREEAIPFEQVMSEIRASLHR